MIVVKGKNVTISNKCIYKNPRCVIITQKSISDTKLIP